MYQVTYKNGQWDEPINLGPEVNTAGDGSFPNIKDGIGLITRNGNDGYFTSHRTGKTIFTPSPCWISSSQNYESKRSQAVSNYLVKAGLTIAV